VDLQDLKENVGLLEFKEFKESKDRKGQPEQLERTERMEQTDWVILDLHLILRKQFLLVVKLLRQTYQHLQQLSKLDNEFVLLAT